MPANRGKRDGEAKPPKPVDRVEMDLLRQSGRRRWNIPDAMRSDALRRLWAAIEDPKISQRDLAALTRVLAAFDRVDSGDDRNDLIREAQKGNPDANVRDVVGDMTDAAKRYEAEGDDDRDS